MPATHQGYILPTWSPSGGHCRIRLPAVRAEVIVSMKFPPGVEWGTHYHTGIVVAHTVSGAWRYRESDWVSRAGDTLYEVAGSSHTPESFEDTEVFFYMIGELLFLDGDKILRQENHQTSLERYANYCVGNGIPMRDLTSWHA